jgi:hypothetical protein
MQRALDLIDAAMERTDRAAAWIGRVVSWVAAIAVIGALYAIGIGGALYFVFSVLPDLHVSTALMVAFMLGAVIFRAP